MRQVKRAADALAAAFAELAPAVDKRTAMAEIEAFVDAPDSKARCPGNCLCRRRGLPGAP